MIMMGSGIMVFATNIEPITGNMLNDGLSTMGSEASKESIGRTIFGSEISAKETAPLHQHIAEPSQSNTATMPS